MLKRYPHTATIRYYGEPVKDDNGIYTESTATDKEVTCRFEPAGDSVYNAQGGITELAFGFKVYLPLQSFTIPSKATIIKDSVEMPISRVDVYQRHIVLWV